MTREEKQKAIYALKKSVPFMAMTQEEFNDYIQTLNQVMDLLEQEPCEDAISRDAAIDLIADYELSMDEVVRGIHALPPVTPQIKTECSCEQIKWERDTAIAQLKELGYGLGEKPKTGHWIEVFDEIDSLGNKKTWYHKCSICGNENSGWGEYKYCPNCGAKMVEPHESEG